MKVACLIASLVWGLGILGTEWFYRSEGGKGMEGKAERRSREELGIPWVGTKTLSPS